MATSARIDRVRSSRRSISAQDPRCEFCREPIVGVIDNFLVLNSRWDIPGTRFGVELPLAFFAHNECAAEVDPFPFLYYIELKRIVAYTNKHGERHGDCLTGWTSHLREKPWFLHEMIAGLDAAHTLAKRLSSPKRAVVVLESQATRDLPGDARSKVTPKLRLQIFARDGHRCVKCGGCPPLELDHIMPVSRGGSSDPDNLQSLCVPCNRRKRDRVDA